MPQRTARPAGNERLSERLAIWRAGQGPEPRPRPFVFLNLERMRAGNSRCGFFRNQAGRSMNLDNLDIRVMCAIGLRGQLGLNGRLPWEGSKERPFQEDVARFFEVTRGHVLMAGPRTVASVPDFAFKDRTIVELRSSMEPEEVLSRFSGRVIFIGGGPPVWARYAQFVRHWDVTRLPYDGPADRWFDPAWMTRAMAGAAGVVTTPPERASS